MTRVLILLPPSETKTVRTRGAAMNLEQLSLPELTAARRAMVETVAAVSSGPDAAAVLDVNPRLTEQIDRNTALDAAPAMPVAAFYSGVLYDAFDLATLEGSARRRATSRVLIFSPLYGVLRLTDRVAPYRVGVCGRLPELGSVRHYWREHLAQPLAAAATSRGLLIDARSGPYGEMWRPPAELASRWVRVTVPGASHMAKHTRGLVARHLCTVGGDPRRPEALVALLADAFDVELREPPRAGHPWELRTTERADSSH